ncbi:MAG: ABC transporter permease [Flavobacteriales bacterium]
MSKTSLVIKREYTSRVKKKSFIIMTILGPLLFAGVLILAAWLGVSEQKEHKGLVIDENGLVSQELRDSEHVKFYSKSEDISTKEFKNSSYTIKLYINKKILKLETVDLVYKEKPGFNTQSIIQSRIEEVLENFKMTKNNITPEEYEKIKTHVQVIPVDLETGEKDKLDEKKLIVGGFFAVLIYMFIFLYGSQVMRGVIEEKTSRIVEVIVSSVKPFQLMMGKILGIGMVALTQFLIWVILTFTFISFGGSYFLFDSTNPAEVVNQPKMTEELKKETSDHSKLDISSNPVLSLLNRIDFPLMLAMFLFYFIGGYLLYAALFAAIGAAVDNETDTQQFMLPVTIPLIFAYMLAAASIQSPDGAASVWGSIIPLTSPILMMIRIAFSVPIWQTIVSMLALIGGFILTTWIAARIYRTGILMYGKKPTWKELYKWLTYSG